MKKIGKWQLRAGINSELFMVLRRLGSQFIFHEVIGLEQTGRRGDLTPTLHFDIDEKAGSAFQGVLQILNLGTI